MNTAVNAAVKRAGAASGRERAAVTTEVRRVRNVGEYGEPESLFREAKKVSGLGVLGGLASLALTLGHGSARARQRAGSARAARGQCAGSARAVRGQSAQARQCAELGG